MDFIRDFAGLFCLSICANISGQAAGQISTKKAVFETVAMLLATALGVAAAYYLSPDKDGIILEIAIAAYAVSFFFGWKGRALSVKR